MKGNLTPTEALRPPGVIGWEFRVVASPGIASRMLEGRAGTLLHGRGRKLIYLRKGRRVCWFEWRQVEPMLPFPDVPQSTAIPGN